MTSPSDPKRALGELDPERRFDRPPELQRLANGRYSVVIGAAGNGGSECEGIALTRWRADPVEDGDGWFIYLRDLDSGRFWSIGYQPTGGEPGALCGPAGAERVDDPARARTGSRPRSRSHSGRTSRSRSAGAASRTGRRGRAGSRSRAISRRCCSRRRPMPPIRPSPSCSCRPRRVPERHLLLATRRPRGAGEPGRWLAHWLIGAPIRLSTTRPTVQRFIGRGRSLAAPAALASGDALAGTTGNVLDPILGLRTIVELAPGERRPLAFGLALRRDAGGGARARRPPRAASPTSPPIFAHGPDRRDAGRGADPRRCRAAGPLSAGAGRRARDRPLPGGADLRQRLRRLRRRRPRVRDRAVTPGQRPPLPWTHVIANETLRLHRLRERRRHDLVAATAARTG